MCIHIYCLQWLGKHYLSWPNLLILTSMVDLVVFCCTKVTCFPVQYQCSLNESSMLLVEKVFSKWYLTSFFKRLIILDWCTGIVNMAVRCNETICLVRVYVVIISKSQDSWRGSSQTTLQWDVWSQAFHYEFHKQWNAYIFPHVDSTLFDTV